MTKRIEPPRFEAERRTSWWDVLFMLPFDCCFSAGCFFAFVIGALGALLMILF